MLQNRAKRVKIKIILDVCPERGAAAAGFKFGNKIIETIFSITEDGNNGF